MAKGERSAPEEAVGCDGVVEVVHAAFDDARHAFLEPLDVRAVPAERALDAHLLRERPPEHAAAAVRVQHATQRRHPFGALVFVRRTEHHATAAAARVVVGCKHWHFILEH